MHAEIVTRDVVTPSGKCNTNLMLPLVLALNTHEPASRLSFAPLLSLSVELMRSHKSLVLCSSAKTSESNGACTLMCPM